MKFIVTGGAGFIGSHLVDALVASGHEVAVIDDLSSGKHEYINSHATFVKKDIRKDLTSEFAGADAIFHFAADPDVRGSAQNQSRTFDLNVRGTFAVLESARAAGDVKHVVFASTSTVYGEALVLPTPEGHPCAPISNYGASKLAGEAYLAAYAGSYGIRGTALRFANIFGERSTHGVMFDFYNKLKQDPTRLEILGDGQQDKSYLHVSDCVEAVLCAWKNQKRAYDVFNVGSTDKTTVSEIAQLMCDELGVAPSINYTGTKRGWIGDVQVMLLDIRKIEKLGWREKTPFETGLKRYIKWIKQ